MPYEISTELVQREPWLAEHREQSVTELEILHGVLNNTEMADHAFFYFRDPAYVDSLPPKEQQDFRELPTPGEIERLGAEQAELRAEDRKQKLKALKQRIRDSGFPVRENYTNPK